MQLNISHSLHKYNNNSNKFSKKKTISNIFFDFVKLINIE